MGAWAAEILAEQGGKVIAVSDVSGAIHNEAGLDIKVRGGGRREGREGKREGGAVVGARAGRQGVEEGKGKGGEGGMRVLSLSLSLSHTHTHTHTITLYLSHPPLLPPFQSLRRFVASGKRLVDFPEATKVDAKDLLTLPCDLLIPAAMGGVITGEGERGD